MISRFCIWLTPVALLVATTVSAQQHAHHGGQPTKTADTPQPVASVAPSAGYTSAFQDYRRFRLDEPMVDWRSINDDMAGLGGHAGHLRGTALPAETKPKAVNHSQHGGKP